MGKEIESSEDSLLGGAAMSPDDLEIVEAQEIRWLFSVNDGEKD